MKGLRKGQFKRASTHVACRVRIHVGVGQRCRALDVESPALPAASARSASMERDLALAMERYMRGFDSAQNSRWPATIHRQQ